MVKGATSTGSANMQFSAAIASQMEGDSEESEDWTASKHKKSQPLSGSASCSPSSSSCPSPRAYAQDAQPADTMALSTESINQSTATNLDVGNLDQGINENRNILGDTTDAGTCEIELDGIVYSLKASLNYSGDSCDSESDEENDAVYTEKLPPDLVRKVIDLCDEKHVDYLHITHGPTPGNKDRITLTVQGAGAEEISDDLKCFSNQRFPKFDIECEDTGYLYHNQFWGKRCGDIQVVKDMVVNQKWVPVEKASCGIILAGKAMNKANEPSVLYAVFSAHLVISTSHCERLVAASPTIDMDEIDATIKLQGAKYHLQTHNQRTKLDLIEYPMITFGHYFTMDDHKTEKEEKESAKKTKYGKRTPHLRFMKDIAIARLSDMTPEFIEKLQDAMSSKELYSGHKMKRYEIGEVLPVRDPRKLLELHQRKIDIKIGPVNGNLYFVGDSSWRDQMRPDARQRSFTIDFTTKNHALHHGNSGQVIYAIDSRKDMLYPLGILAGEPKASLKKPNCGSNIYFAALLAPNLDCIEERHHLHVADLKSISRHSNQHESVDVTLANLSVHEPVKASNRSKTQPPSSQTKVSTFEVRDFISNESNSRQRDQDVSADEKLTNLPPSVPVKAPQPYENQPKVANPDTSIGAATAISNENKTVKVSKEDKNTTV